MIKRMTALQFKRLQRINEFMTNLLDSNVIKLELIDGCLLECFSLFSASSLLLQGLFRPNDGSPLLTDPALFIRAKVDFLGRTRASTRSLEGFTRACNNNTGVWFHSHGRVGCQITEHARSQHARPNARKLTREVHGHVHGRVLHRVVCLISLNTPVFPKHGFM